MQLVKQTNGRTPVDTHGRMVQGGRCGDGSPRKVQQPIAFCTCGTHAGPNPYGFPYDAFMADVVTTGEARDALHQIAKRFDNRDGEPVYFGSHRRAQGVIVPVDVWEKLLEQAEDELDLTSARQRWPMTTGAG